MENNKIEENKSIAHFMGLSFSPECVFVINTGTANGWIPFADLKYSSSWDWLMPVVEKIEGMHNYSYKIILHSSIGLIIDEGLTNKPIIVRGCGMNRIESTYEMVMKFIKLHNNNAK